MKKVIAICFILSIAAAVNANAQVVGGGDLKFQQKGASPVVFSHEVHVKNKGLKCTGCHYQVFQMTHGSYKMDMSKITKGAFCGKCHNGEKSFDVNEKKNCAKCHK